MENNRDQVLCVFCLKKSVYFWGITDNKTYLYLTASCHILYGEKCKTKYLGCFSLNKPFQAFTCYKNFKEKYIKEVADEYKDLIPNKLYEALYRYEVEIND